MRDERVSTPSLRLRPNAFELAKQVNGLSSNQQLATALGVDLSTLKRVKAGQPPTNYLLASMAQICRVTSLDILCEVRLK